LNRRIAFIGAGTIIEMFYIPQLKSMGFSDFCVYDSNSNRTEFLSKAYNINTGTFEQCATADVIILGIPPGNKFDLLYSLIAPGKTIICEKPFVHHLNQAKQLVNKAKLANCDLLVAHIRRLFSGIDIAHAHLRNNSYGKLIKAHIMEGNRYQYKTQSNYISNNPLGGVLLDTGSHALDAFLYVTNMHMLNNLNVEVRNAKRDKTEPSHENQFQFILNDIEVNLHLSRYETLANKMNLYFEHALVEVPLLLKPSIRITPNENESFVVHAGTSANYMSEAFRLQLYHMLIKKDASLFEANSFISLSGILQQLLAA